MVVGTYLVLVVIDGSNQKVYLLLEEVEGRMLTKNSEEDQGNTNWLVCFGTKDADTKPVYLHIAQLDRSWLLERANSQH